MSRLDDIVRFYSLLDRLEQRVGGKRTLVGLAKFRYWPRRGVYLFFEPSEFRHDSGAGLRVVRVGTHALGAGSLSTLSQHRGSIFRLLVGQALIAAGNAPRCDSWGVKGDATKASAALGIDREALNRAELPVEHAVTQYVGSMPFLWLNVDDDPGPQSRRGKIERNAIALLSNLGRPNLDPPSLSWLGHSSDRVLVRDSGLWNQRHVDETHDPSFLDMLEMTVEQAGTHD